MSAMLDTTPAFVLLFAVTAWLLLIVLLWQLRRGQRALKAQLAALAQEGARQRDAIDALSARLDEQLAGAQRQAKERALAERFDGRQDHYLDAINAAKAGASAEHLIERYQVVQSEAELIVSMHGQHGRATGS